MQISNILMCFELSINVLIMLILCKLFVISFIA